VVEAHGKVALAIPVRFTRMPYGYGTVGNRGSPVRGDLQSHHAVVNARPSAERGRSSGVEHNLAKVGVEGSNPFARSSRFSNLTFPLPE
jgi:hypothetical protein